MTVKQAETGPWQAQGREKRETVRRLFGDIAPSYDRLNGLISFSLHHRWRRIAVRRLELDPGDFALDLCCGTGDFMRPLAGAVGDQGCVAGMDFCRPMLALAQGKGLDRLAMADACQLPIASGVLDGVAVGWGIRNVEDIDAAHREIARVLKPGGRFVSLDMAQPQNPIVRGVSRWVLRLLVPALGALAGRRKAYTYLPRSTERFWSREALAASMEAAGLRDVGHEDLLFGNVCLHWGAKP